MYKKHKHDIKTGHFFPAYILINNKKKKQLFVIIITDVVWQFFNVLSSLINVERSLKI